MAVKIAITIAFFVISCFLYFCWWVYAGLKPTPPTWDRYFLPDVKTEFHLEEHNIPELAEIIKKENQAIKKKSKNEIQFQLYNWLPKNEIVVGAINYGLYIYDFQQRSIKFDKYKAALKLDNHCITRFGLLRSTSKTFLSSHGFPRVYSGYAKDYKNIKVESYFRGQRGYTSQFHCDYLVYLLKEENGFNFPKTVSIMSKEYQLSDHAEDRLYLYPRIRQYEDDTKKIHVHFNKDYSIKQVYRTEKEVPYFIYSYEYARKRNFSDTYPSFDYDPVDNVFYSFRRSFTKKQLVQRKGDTRYFRRMHSFKREVYEREDYQEGMFVDIFTPELEYIDSVFIKHGEWIKDRYYNRCGLGYPGCTRYGIIKRGDLFFLTVNGRGIKPKQRGIYELSNDKKSWEPILTGPYTFDYKREWWRTVVVSDDACKFAYITQENILMVLDRCRPKQ